jgi:clan AA aspartic protease
LGFQSWHTGPFIDLSLSSPLNPALSHDLTGIVDTGASGFCVDSRILIDLGLKDTGAKVVEMADGTRVQTTKYAARVIIPELEFNDLIEVTGVPMANPSRRVLIGRSFLKPYILNYHGRSERFEFHLYRDTPSQLIEDMD